jgi:hypothetical protein
MFLLLPAGAQAPGGSFSRSSSTTIPEAAQESSSSGSSSNTQEHATTAAAAAASGEAAQEEKSHDVVWLRYSDVGLFSQPDDLSQAKLGTFYQVLDAASGLEVRCCNSWCKSQDW